MSRAEERRQAREEGGSDVQRFYMVFGVVAAIGVAIVGYNVASGMMSNAAFEPVPVEGLDDLNVLAERARGVTKGDPNAPITIVEFGDYQCPGCAQFATGHKAQMELAFVETGQAKFVYYDLPIVSIHPNAFLAARAARCAEDQDMFWQFHDELFRQQPRWSVMTNAAAASQFEEYASQLGLNTGEFDSCLNSDRHADLVSANMQLGQQMRVASTPTILINANNQTMQAPASAQGIAEVIEELTGGGAN